MIEEEDKHLLKNKQTTTMSFVIVATWSEMKKVDNKRSELHLCQGKCLVAVRDQRSE